jgi:hypothetical protein
MKLTAYVLAADPAWVQASVRSYYDIVEEIVISYDENSKGWTGAPIPVDECVSKLKAIDKDKKMRFVGGHFARLDQNPMVNDTYQRQCAFDIASSGADWVIAIDADEVLPNPGALLKMLDYAAEREIPAVEWPMRLFFHRLEDGRFLEVCSKSRTERFEYPGPIAARPGAQHTDARHAKGDYLRPVVIGDKQSPQVRCGMLPGESRIENLRLEDAILHFSWARSAADVRSKVASWSHNEGLKSWLFYNIYWKSAPRTWPLLRNFHPFVKGLWPRLKPTELSLQGINL